MPPLNEEFILTKTEVVVERQTKTVLLSLILFMPCLKENNFISKEFKLLLVW